MAFAPVIPAVALTFSALLSTWAIGAPFPNEEGENWELPALSDSCLVRCWSYRAQLRRGCLLGSYGFPESAEKSEACWRLRSFWPSEVNNVCSSFPCDASRHFVVAVGVDDGRVLLAGDPLRNLGVRALAAVVGVALIFLFGRGGGDGFG